MKRSLRIPLFWLLLQGVAFGLVLWRLGRFQPVSFPDTPAYEGFPFHSWSAALEHIRTFGYPVFLRWAGAIAPAHAAVPILQFAIHVGAILVFYLCLRDVISSTMTRLAAASTLLYSNTTLRYLSNVGTDMLASSFSILTIGIFLYAVSRRRGGWIWLVLAASVFLTYQIRPAYLFLIPLLPLLGPALAWLLKQRADTGTEVEQHRLGRLSGVLCLVVAVPLLTFATVRWLTVGQFGLVSFGGNTLAGLVGMQLTDDMVDDLPTHLQPLAKRALRKRRSLAGSDPKFHSEPTMQYMEIEQQHDANIWHVFTPAAREIYGDYPPLVNRRLWELSIAIIRKKPGMYVQWLGKATWRGVYMIVSELVANPVYLLLLFLLLAAHTRWVWRRLRFPDIEDSPRDSFVEINALLLVAVTFAAAKLALVIVTLPPLGRFMDAAGVFLSLPLMQLLAIRLGWERNVR